MGPFRLLPAVELGAGSVGLVRAVRRALRAVPRGGRVLARDPMWMRPHVAGMVGSAGLLASAVALVAMFESVMQIFFLGPAFVGGVSLALILRALDPVVIRRTLPASAVAATAKRALVGMARASKRSERGACADAACERVLRRALARAKRADVTLWIPQDVIGRAELLLARLVARTGGPSWSNDDGRLREVEELLRLAADHLDDPREACRDLRIVENASGARGRVAFARIVERSEDEESADREQLDVEDEHAAGRARA